MNQRTADNPHTFTRRGAFRFLHWGDLLREPAVEWLVEGHLPAGGLTTLTGPANSYKTFLALDLALSVITGEPWHGRNVVSGPVVYVAAEGHTGAVRQRIQAWLDAHAPSDPDGLAYVPGPVNLMRPEETVEFLQEAEPMRPRLIIIDTLARCMVGGDENSARDVGQVLDHIGLIQRRTGAAVLVVHHSGHNQTRERGSSALRAAVDTAVQVGANGLGVSLACKKQKDAEPFADVHLRPEHQSGSLILRPMPAGSSAAQDRWNKTISVLHDAEDSLSGGQLQSLVGGNAGDNRTMWRKMEDDPECPVSRKDKRWTLDRQRIPVANAASDD